MRQTESKCKIPSQVKPHVTWKEVLPHCGRALLALTLFPESTHGLNFTAFLAVGYSHMPDLVSARWVERCGPPQDWPISTSEAQSSTFFFSILSLIGWRGSQTGRRGWRPKTEQVQVLLRSRRSRLSPSYTSANWTGMWLKNDLQYSYQIEILEWFVIEYSLPWCTHKMEKT